MSAGLPGATVNVGTKGIRGTYGLPGTGLSYRTQTTPWSNGGDRHGGGPIQPSGDSGGSPRLSAGKWFWGGLGSFSLGLILLFIVPPLGLMCWVLALFCVLWCVAAGLTDGGKPRAALSPVTLPPADQLPDVTALKTANGRRNAALRRAELSHRLFQLWDKLASLEPGTDGYDRLLRRTISTAEEMLVEAMKAGNVKAINACYELLVALGARTVPMTEAQQAQAQAVEELKRLLDEVQAVSNQLKLLEPESPEFAAKVDELGLLLDRSLDGAKRAGRGVEAVQELIAVARKYYGLVLASDCEDAEVDAFCEQAQPPPLPQPQNESTQLAVYNGPSAKVDAARETKHLVLQVIGVVSAVGLLLGVIASCLGRHGAEVAKSVVTQPTNSPAALPGSPQKAPQRSWEAKDSDPGVPSVPAVSVPKGLPVERWELPDRAKTPGDIFEGVTVDDLRQPGYSERHRQVPAELKREIYAWYGISDHTGFVIDHLVPVELAGRSELGNLWPQRIEDAKRKDRLEAKLHELVLSGQLELGTAQREIAANWIEAYKKYVSP